MRKQAIHILAVCASGWDSTVSAARWLGASKEARELAYNAWMAARKRVNGTGQNQRYFAEKQRMVYAEAQCMLLEGWTPDAK